MSSVNFRWLNTLPDSVLAKIVSFLPAHDAARTVLLRTFGNIWTTIDRLDFDDGSFVDEDSDGYDTIKFIRFVRYFIMLHKCSKVCKFRVSFSYMLNYLAKKYDRRHGEFVEWKLAHEVEMWIRFALTRGVEVLDLGFGVRNPAGRKFKLPAFAWTSDSLTEVRLLNCEVKFSNKVWMGLLKILTLDKVKISNETFCKVIGCCPVLQDLAITDCDGLSELSFTAPNIGNLRVMNDCKWKLTVNCPNVRSFVFSGCIEFVELINLSSVKIVNLGIDLIWNDKLKQLRQFKRFLDKVQHAEILMLDIVSFSVLTYRVLENHPCPYNKWKRVVLHTWLSRDFIRGLSSLLRYSSCLEELIIHITDPSEYSPKGVHLAEVEQAVYKQFDEDVWSFQSLKQSLKNVTMHGLLRSSFDAQIDLVRIILHNALVLDKVVIFAQGNAQSLEEIGFTCQELWEISKKLQAFRKASERASVYLLYQSTAK